MLNKKILLGTLVAGAFMLPLAANAGLVSGPCVSCHTMHDSQNGSTMDGLNASLLRGASCEGCHATGITNDPATGRYDNGNFAAPQVDDASNPNLAGYFVNSTAAAALLAQSNQHNPYNDLTSVAQDGILLDAAPGGTGAMNGNCQGCHNAGGITAPLPDLTGCCR
jgi:hypothetical protein